MAEFLIKDEDFADLKGKVIIVTGGSSGIGLATVKLLLSHGAFVVNGDVLPPAELLESPALTFHTTDVTVWSDLLSLFKKAKETFGRVDHVFANAGISHRANYLATELDENGDLKEPTHQTLDVNLKGVINTTTLAIYHIRQNPEGGSIVMTASVASLQRFRAVDYAAAKHGVLGYMRGLRQVIEQEKLPVRVNAVAPSWTVTGVVPAKIMEQLGEPMQSPGDVARATALLMADRSRQGHLVHIGLGKYKEIDEAILLPAFASILGDTNMEDTTLQRMIDAMDGVFKDRV